MMQKLNKLAKACGFASLGESKTNPLKNMQNALHDDTKGASCLSDVMLFDFFDEELGLAFNKGSVGFLFEINGLVGSDIGICKNLNLFFEQELPKGSYLQFMVATSDIGPIMDRWQKGRKSGGRAIDILTKYRRQFIEDAAKDFAKASEGRLARDFKTYVSFSRIGSNISNKCLEDILQFKTKLFNKLKTEHFGPQFCGAADLIKLSRMLLGFESTRQREIQYDPLNDLNVQIATGNRTIVEQDLIKHLNTKCTSRYFAPATLPKSFSLAQMIDLLGSETKVIPAKFVICYMVANSLAGAGTSRLLSRGSSVISAAAKSYTRDDLVARSEADDWIRVKAIAKSGEIFLEESMLVMISAPDEDIDSASEALKSLWNNHDFRLVACTNLQRICALSILPTMAASYWSMLKFFKLTRFALSGDVVAKLPLQAEWKGARSSGALLMGRRGQLFNFNPFERVGGGGNYNICVMAPSGAGKSFLLEELTQSMIATGASVFILDIGGSYQNICKNFSGEMIRFNQESKISLNPFADLSNSGLAAQGALELISRGKSLDEVTKITGIDMEKLRSLELGLKSGTNTLKEMEAIELIEVQGIGALKHFVTKDSIIYAKALVASMCNNFGDARSEAIIERAIIQGIAEYGQNLDITKLAGVLELLKNHKGEQIDGASSMADSLFPYTIDGIHGRFFGSSKEGAQNANFNKSLTVFELEELVNDKPLLSIVLQVVLMQITMQFLCGDRSKRFMLIVDEAWMILDHAAAFLERFARTVRKYGGSLVVCTQDLSSFTNDCGTKACQAAVLESSTWKMILAQKEEGIATFARSKAYEKYIGLISSIRKCSANKFSEVLISTNGINIVGRLAVDAYSTALFSTEHDDFNFLLKKEQEGLSKHEAIKLLSKKYGKLPELELEDVN